MSAWSTQRSGRIAWRRCAIWLGIFAAGSGAVVAQAQFGPHANAILIPHIQSGLEFSYGQSYEGLSNLRACRDAIVSGPVGSSEEAQGRIFYLMLSLEDCPGPLGFCAIDFGFAQYDFSALAIVGHGFFCPPRAGILTIPSAGWPGPNEGVAITYTGPQEDRTRREKICELAWFAAYVYGAQTLPLGPNPMTGMVGITDDANPPNLDELEEWQLGVLAFGVAGYNPCAPPNVRGACCLGGRCQELYRDDCDLQGGVFQGENTDCFPNPCLPPKATTWGRLKRMYQSN